MKIVINFEEDSTRTPICIKDLKVGDWFVWNNMLFVKMSNAEFDNIWDVQRRHDTYFDNDACVALVNKLKLSELQQYKKM